jgi:hypothetical protein
MAAKFCKDFAVKKYHYVANLISSNKRRIPGLLMLAVAIIGSSIQVITVSNQYFKYVTTTDVSFERPKVLVPHKIGICIKFSEILLEEKLRDETGIMFGDADVTEQRQADEDLLTVKQIFDYTPPEDRVIKECMYRLNNWSIRESNTTDCYPHFNVSKFMTNEMMCYKINHLMEKWISTSSVSKSKYYTFMIYKVVFSHLFRNSSLVFPIIWMTGDLPHASRAYAEPLPYFRRKGRDFPIYNTILISPADTTVTRLPAPYDTKCLNAKDEVPLLCHRDCMVENFASRLNIVPTFELIDQPIDMKPLTYRLMNQPHFARLFSKLSLKCKKQCEFTPCVDSFTQTFARVSREYCDDLETCESLVIYSIINTQASIQTKAQPSMSFVDYFSFVTGSFGTWFGLSFLSLNPKLLLSFLNKRKRRRTATIRVLHQQNMSIAHTR